MRKHNYIGFFFFAILFIFLTAFISKNNRILSYKPLIDSGIKSICTDSFYLKAYDELNAMLEDSEQISFKRAVFITESAYEKDQLD